MPAGWPWNRLALSDTAATDAICNDLSLPIAGLAPWIIVSQYVLAGGREAPCLPCPGFGYRRVLGGDDWSFRSPPPPMA